MQVEQEAGGESSSSGEAASSASSASAAVRTASEVEGAAPPKVAEVFLCPITLELMRDPVSTVDGYTYERAAIEQWLATHDTSPNTGLKLENRLLVPCRIVRSQIHELLKQHPEM